MCADIITGNEVQADPSRNSAADAVNPTPTKAELVLRLVEQDWFMSQDNVTQETLIRAIVNGERTDLESMRTEIVRDEIRMAASRYEECVLDKLLPKFTTETLPTLQSHILTHDRVRVGLEECFQESMTPFSHPPIADEKIEYSDPLTDAG